MSIKTYLKFLTSKLFRRKDFCILFKNNFATCGLYSYAYCKDYSDGDVGIIFYDGNVPYLVDRVEK